MKNIMAKPLKKTLIAVLASGVLSLSYAADSSAQAEKLSQSILDNIIMRDGEKAQLDISHLKSAIAENTGDKRSAAVDKAFSNFVADWKAVQTAYIVGEADSSMIDTPRLMDTFHEGNENLSEQIQRALKSGDEARVALFKNTFKSINALGLLLYTDETLSKTEKTYADYVLTTLSQHLSDIQAAYKAQEKVLTSDEDQFMSYALNALIDSSYKLKEWRIGEAAGLTKKYQDKPDNRRQEYGLSGNSLVAIAAILGVHADMMEKRDYVNLGSAAIAQGAKKEVDMVRQLIAKAQKQVAQLQADKVIDFSDKRIKPLYETLSQLNDAYYQSLVHALPVQAKILDADGD